MGLYCRGRPELAPDSLLDSYSEERVHGADENILNSTRATDFLTPKSEISKVFRNAVLELAQKHTFARPLVNSGRLSVPCVYDGLSLNGPDALNGPTRARVGATCADARMADGFLLGSLGGDFTILAINTAPPAVTDVDGIALRTIQLDTNRDDPTGAIAARYLGDETSGVYLIRPDQHVVARWATAGVTDIQTAVRTATGRGK